MAKTAIALIVVGTGETDEGEVFDLLEDAYPEDAYEEVGLVIPVDKDLYSKTVANAVKWYGDDKNVYPIQTNGASLPRAATKLGSGNQMVDKFTDAINKDDFKDWDEVHVLLALPEDQESDEYEFYAEVADLALEAGFVVKDLTAGLDDVVMTDPEVAAEPEPEPEEEDEKPKRSRRKAAEPEEEPEAEVEDEDEKPRSRRSSRAAKAETVEEVQEAAKQAEEPAEEPVETEVDHLLAQRVESLENRIEELEDLLSRIGMVLAGPAPSADPVVEAIDEIEAEKDADAPKRGRGRPRTDFDVRQIWDEDTEDWVPRPKGRLKKTTKWRTIHAETNEVLEEGTA